MNFQSVVVAGLLLSLGACASTQASYDVVGIDDAATEILDGFEHPLTAHVAAQVVKFDVLGNQTTLYSQQFPRATVDGARKFHIASMSKQFTGAAIALLEQRGELNLDDLVQSHVSPWPSYARNVTVRNLLQHQGGLPGYVDECPMDVEGVLDFVNEASRLVPLESGDPYDPVNAPTPRYSNSGYVMLALVVESVSGKTFPRFLEDEFFAPLGMDDTYVREVGGAKVPMVATHYANGVWATHGKCTWIYGDGGVMTTLDDMGRWCKLFTGAAGILVPDQVRMMVDDAAVFSGAGSFGLRHDNRFDVAGDGSERRERIRHGGVWQGAVSNFCWFPEDRIGVVLFFNGDGAMDTDRDYTGGQTQRDFLTDALCRAVYASELPDDIAAQP